MNQFIDSTVPSGYADHPIVKPLADKEVRIVILGGVGMGKSIIGYAIMKLLGVIAPNLKITLHEHEMSPEDTMASGNKALFDRRALDEMGKKGLNVHIHTAVTNEKGNIKGVGLARRFED